jgi:ATP-dependent protease ClpP protease subunit
MNEVAELTINWNRSILISGPIDDELVRSLTPKIFTLRQESSDPITIGIDSPGGSLSSLDVLLGLLTGPDQDGRHGKIITVATHRAYSAAANFLAFGDYSVALRHSQVLYHDVRFGGMLDVTPEKARDAAKSLQDTNYAFSLRLAHHVISRLIWIYIDLRPHFRKNQSNYPDIHKCYASLVEAYAPKIDGFESVDLASFATALWANLSTANDKLIHNVMERLARWIHLTKLVKSFPTYRKKGSKVIGLLDGARDLHKIFSEKAGHFESSEEQLKLLLSLIIADISNTETNSVKFSSMLDRSIREFSIMESMNDPEHISNASELMLRHSHIFFIDALDRDFDSIPEEEKADLFNKAAPHARLLWHFCVLLCRELFEGEHILKPTDAQLLGLVDEVAGGGPIQSKRDFRVERAKAKAKPSTPA